MESCLNGAEMSCRAQLTKRDNADSGISRRETLQWPVVVVVMVAAAAAELSRQESSCGFPAPATMDAMTLSGPAGQKRRRLTKATGHLSCTLLLQKPIAEPPSSLLLSPQSLPRNPSAHHSTVYRLCSSIPLPDHRLAPCPFRHTST